MEKFLKISVIGGGEGQTQCGIFHIFFFFFLTGSLILYIQSEYSAVNLIVSSFHLNSLNEKNVVMSAWRCVHMSSAVTTRHRHQIFMCSAWSSFWRKNFRNKVNDFKTLHCTADWLTDKLTYIRTFTLFAVRGRSDQVRKIPHFFIFYFEGFP